MVFVINVSVTTDWNRGAVRRRPICLARKRCFRPLKTFSGPLTTFGTQLFFPKESSTEAAATSIVSVPDALATSNTNTLFVLRTGALSSISLTPYLPTVLDISIQFIMRSQHLTHVKKIPLLLASWKQNVRNVYCLLMIVTRPKCNWNHSITATT